MPTEFKGFVCSEVWPLIFIKCLRSLTFYIITLSRIYIKWENEISFEHLVKTLGSETWTRKVTKITSTTFVAKLIIEDFRVDISKQVLIKKKLLIKRIVLKNWTELAHLNQNLLLNQLKEFFWWQIVCDFSNRNQ